MMARALAVLARVPRAWTSVHPVGMQRSCSVAAWWVISGRARHEDGQGNRGKGRRDHANSTTVPVSAARPASAAAPDRFALLSALNLKPTRPGNTWPQRGTRGVLGGAQGGAIEAPASVAMRGGASVRQRPHAVVTDRTHAHTKFRAERSRERLRHAALRRAADAGHISGGIGSADKRDKEIENHSAVVDEMHFVGNAAEHNVTDKNTDTDWPAVIDVVPHESPSGKRRRERVAAEVGADGWLPKGYPHPASLSPVELAKECDVQRTRRGGPGGQHRNKVATAVVLTHTPTRITAEAGERRNQVRNHENAVRRLRIALAVKLRRPLDPSEWEPGPVLITRCLSSGRDGTVRINIDHADYATVIADLLDGLAAHGWRLGPVAAAIDSVITVSRVPIRRNDIVNLLAKYAPALQLVNQRRSELGLDTLKQTKFRRR